MAPRIAHVDDDSDIREAVERILRKTTYAQIHKRYPQIQTIFLTSLGDMIRPYFDDGSNEWVCIMEKPVEPISLLATINDRLNKTGEAA